LTVFGLWLGLEVLHAGRRGRVSAVALAYKSADTGRQAGSQAGTLVLYIVRISL
jgi:hypothetical protein